MLGGCGWSRPLIFKLDTNATVDVWMFCRRGTGGRGYLKYCSGVWMPLREKGEERRDGSGEMEEARRGWRVTNHQVEVAQQTQIKSD